MYVFHLPGILLMKFNRLAVWYALLTAIFRCPSSTSELSASSPQLCKPYLDIKTRVTPYIEPHYAAYISPHVEKIRPYVDTVNERVYTPVSKFTLQNYEVYGAPKIAQLRAYAEKEWESKARPQIEAVRTTIQTQYGTYLHPHIEKATGAIQPYYNQATSAATTHYHHTLIPAYNAALPYGRKFYSHGHHVTANIVFPYVRYAEASSRHFLTRILWPKLRILYGDNVEPQLTRISQRMGRYRDSKKLESIVEASTPSTPVSPSASAGDAFSDSPEALSLSSLINEASTESTDTPTTTKSSTTSSSTKSPEEIRETISSDLRTWQEKFANAADKGSDDLEERVREISNEQIFKQADGHGAALLIEVEEAIQAAIEGMKSAIQDAVARSRSHASEEDLTLSLEQTKKAIQDLAKPPFAKAQKLREWRKKYDAETYNLIKAASDSTLDVIDNIRDLGLQEIGMRWAWMDGVTYKDWEKYHEMRKTFDEWRNEVLARAFEHESFAQAKERGKMIEDNAMDILKAFVEEGNRLKEVARWKLWAQDDSDDFSNKKAPAYVAKVADDIIGGAKSVIGDSQEQVQSLVSAAQKSAGNAASSISTAVAGEETGTIEGAASKLSEAIIGTEPGVAEKAATKASEAVLGSQGTIESISSAAASAGASVVSAAKHKKNQATNSIKGSPAPVEENISNAISSATESIVSLASEASEKPKHAWGGAMAQAVAEAKSVVYDDVVESEASISGKIQSMISQAGDKASDITRAISEALIQPTNTQGSVEAATSLASEQYEKAFAAASSMLYGPEQGVGNKIASVASERYEQAVTAASYAIYGTPTPVLSSLAAEASSAYQRAIAGAAEQYIAAKSKLSVQVSGTPAPAHSQLLSSIEKGYADTLSVASKNLQEALKYTDSVRTKIVGPTPGALESISAVAASRLSEGLKSASSQ
jgi:hypothetical protein